MDLNMIILKPQEIRTLLMFHTKEDTAKRSKISHRNYPAVHKGAVLVKRTYRGLLVRGPLSKIESVTCLQGCN